MIARGTLWGWLTPTLLPSAEVYPAFLGVERRFSVWEVFMEGRVAYWVSSAAESVVGMAMWGMNLPDLVSSWMKYAIACRVGEVSFQQHDHSLFGDRLTLAESIGDPPPMEIKTLIPSFFTSS